VEAWIEQALASYAKARWKAAEMEWQRIRAGDRQGVLGDADCPPRLP